MKQKTLAGIVAALAVGSFLAGCVAPESKTSSGQESGANTSGGNIYSKENNPFFVPLSESEISDPFSMLGQPVTGLKGTVVDSYLGQMTALMGSGDSKAGYYRSFGWLVLRDQTAETHYLIYPAERVFPKGEEIVIGRYWPLNEEVVLSNNKLVNLTTGEKYSQNTFWLDLDFLIQSSAEDGHVDGIIELNSIEYLSEGVGK